MEENRRGELYASERASERANGGESTSAVRMREVRSQSAALLAAPALLDEFAGESRRYITRLYH